MKVFNGTESLGDIISISPNAVKVFIKYKIDFFNRGNKTLNETIAELNLDSVKIIDELENTHSESKIDLSENMDWRKVKNSEIINHIIKFHHTFLKNELPATEILLAKILKVHYDDSGELLTKAYRLFNQIKTEFEITLIKERRYLFPLILEYERYPTEDLFEKISDEIEDTEEERNFFGYTLKELRKITNQYTVPPTGCPTYDMTYARLQDIELNLLYYLHLENNILFKSFNKR